MSYKRSYNSKKDEIKEAGAFWDAEKLIEGQKERVLREGLDKKMIKVINHYYYMYLSNEKASSA